MVCQVSRYSNVRRGVYVQMTGLTKASWWKLKVDGNANQRTTHRVFHLRRTYPKYPSEAWARKRRNLSDGLVSLQMRKR